MAPAPAALSRPAANRPLLSMYQRSLQNLLLMRLSEPPDPVDPSFSELDTLDMPNEPNPISEHLAPPEIPNEPSPISEHLAPPEIPNEPNPISEHQMPSRPAEPGR